MGDLPAMETMTLGFFVFDGEYCDESSRLQMIRSILRWLLSRSEFAETVAVSWIQLQRNEIGDSEE